MLNSSLSLTGKRILVADDDEVCRMIASSRLRAMGAQVRSVGNGWDALQQMLLMPFQAVIVDHDMPILNGAEFCAKVRAVPRFSSIPLILVSARDPEALRQHLPQGGAECAAVFSKPVDFVAVAEVLLRA